jgi:hypothetical protein
MIPHHDHVSYRTVAARISRFGNSDSTISDIAVIDVVLNMLEGRQPQIEHLVKSLLNCILCSVGVRKTTDVSLPPDKTDCEENYLPMEPSASFVGHASGEEGKYKHQRARCFSLTIWIMLWRHREQGGYHHLRDSDHEKSIHVASLL